MITRKHILFAFWTSILICFAVTSHAANLISTSSQGGPSWLSAVWKTNGTGTAVGPPVPGNTYVVAFNGIQVGNNTGEARTRLPTNNGVANYTFPGDSLTLNTNTEIRFKRAQNGSVIAANFPGVNGNPGLIMNGGMFNAGDASVFIVQGKVGVVAQSYICPGNNDGASVDTARGFTISAQLSGSGNMVIWEAGTNNAETISGISNTFSGQWIVKAGWLLGSSSNSLGTNSIIIDPNFNLPETNGDPASFSNNIVNVAGPAVLEVSYDMNNAGVLTLTNGGLMRLHQNIEFSSVVIEGTALTAGTHFYNELRANFPNSFAGGGSGSITVQPFGPPPAVGPQIGIQPLNQRLYAGGTARFLSTGTGPAPLSLVWQKNSNNLTDGGNISGSTNTTLFVSSVSSADAAGYSLFVSNQGGSITSSVASLTMVTTNGEAYESAVTNANPIAFYQLNETGDPSTNAEVFDFVGGYVGTYGTGVQNAFNSITGPGAADGYTGFVANKTAAQFANANVNSRITLAFPWNTNPPLTTITITAWIKSGGPQNPGEGLVFCRGNGTVVGLCLASAVDVNGFATLGYNWNNEFETSSWNSGIELPANQWSLVALVVTPTNATVHLMNTNGLVSATHVYTHVPQGFNGTTVIGDDSGGANGARVFGGAMADVAIFTNALSKAQLVTLFAAASGTSAYAPVIGAQPTNLTLFAGQTAQFSVTAGGSDPLTFEWLRDTAGNNIFNPLSNGGTISGADTAYLTVQNVGTADADNYMVIVSNSVNAVTSSVVSLAVNPTTAAQHITMQFLEVAPQDWDTGTAWSDGQAASVSSASEPGSTYELLPSTTGCLLRSPQNPRTATFPGSVLTVDGNGVWVNGPTATTTNTTEIRFKQPTPGTVIFPRLVLNGGQIDVGNDGVLQILGEIDVVTNSTFYNDNTSLARGYQIDAWLTGTGTIEYHGYNLATFQPSNVNNLNITGTSNTFSGKWNIVIGNLLGSGSNSLGTNDIIIGANAALETTYDVSNATGNLFLSGRMYLHQNDTFQSLFINGIPLSVGTYTAAQLAASFPTNFPTNWTPQTGATNFSTSSGSITVLLQPPPRIVQAPAPAALSLYPTQTASFTVGAQGNLPLFYQWRQGGTNLMDVGNIFGSGTTNLVISNVVPGSAGNYDVIVSNSIGSVTSIVAVLTILPTGPATNLTLNFGGTPIIQPQGSDWTTLTNWSDGQSATTSALSNPGSTYEIVTGARLRSPAAVSASIFPGVQLTVDGSGTFVNNNDSTIGEIRFKHNTPGTVFFPRLIMNGGQLDSGDNGLVIIQGEMDVLSNTPIYVDNAAGQDRAYEIDSFLTGAGTIEYHAFDTTFTGGLNVTGTSNTFSGAWNVIQGPLLGSGSNSLGTNNITIGAGGALETAYDVHNTNGSLVLNGKMFLHQNDTFRTASVNGENIVPGTYTFTQMRTAFPTNFPATWTPILGSSTTNGSGSFTVLVAIPPPIVNVQSSLTNGALQLNWSQGTLQGATNLLGPWTNIVGASPPPFTVTPTNDPTHFYRIKVQ